MDARLGGAALARLMGAGEGLEVDLSRLAGEAERETKRMTELLAEGCRELAPGRPVGDVVAELLADHPDAGQVIAEAQVDKVSQDVEAPVAGVMRRLVDEGVGIRQGEPMAQID